MSQAREDWKFFDQVSDTMCIRDLTAPQSIELQRVSKGRWAAFCIYNDENRIERVLLAKEDVMERVAENDRTLRRGSGKYSFYEDKAFANAGIFCFFDKSHMGEYQDGYESKFDMGSLEKYGDPKADGKSDKRRFVEMACHLTTCNGFDQLADARFGVFFRAHTHLELGVLREKSSGEVKLIEVIAE